MKGLRHGIHPSRPFRPVREPPLPRDHELRAADLGRRVGSDHGSRARDRHQLLRHRQPLRRGADSARPGRRPRRGALRLDRGDHRRLVLVRRRPPGAHRARHQAVRGDGRLAQRRQAVRAEHPAGLRRVAAPAAHRLHRPVPDAPRRPGHPVGRDLAGDGGARHPGQDPLCRLVQLRRLAHRAGQRHRCRPRILRPGQRAVHLQPADQGDRARGAARGDRVRRRRHPVVSARGRAARRRAEEGARGAAPLGRPGRRHPAAAPRADRGV